MRVAKDWGEPCPNPDCCEYWRYTLLHRGNIRSVSTYQTQSGKRRIFQCRACGKEFSQTRDTVFFDRRVSEETIVFALKLLLIRVDLAGIGFVLGVTEQTLLCWLALAAKKAQEINEALLQDLPVTEVQVDEMWNFIARKQSRQGEQEGASESKESPPDGPSDGPSDGQQWVWISFTPQFRLMLAAFVGPRTFESTLTLIQRTAAIVSGVPCFFSDGFSSYLRALLTCYHQLKEFPRTGKRGRPRKPEQEAHPDLVYAQVVKEKKQGKLVSLTERVVCGVERLKDLGLSISTNLLERLNLTMRNALAPLVRKGWSYCKDREQMRRRVLFYQAFYNFARPHYSLRLALSEPKEPTKGLIVPKWQQRTPWQQGLPTMSGTSENVTIRAVISFAAWGIIASLRCLPYRSFSPALTSTRSIFKVKMRWCRLLNSSKSA